MQLQSTLPLTDLASVIEQLRHIEQILQRFVEFGNPAHPVDPANTSLAGDLATSHNGSPENILVSWVEKMVESPNVPFDCYHNLDCPFVTGEVNVTWLNCRFIHDGTTVDAASTLSVNYQIGDTITRDMIQLRLYAGGTRTISEESPVRVTLGFIPAVRGSA